MGEIYSDQHYINTKNYMISYNWTIKNRKGDQE